MPAGMGAREKSNSNSSPSPFDGSELIAFAADTEYEKSSPREAASGGSFDKSGLYGSVCVRSRYFAMATRVPPPLSSIALPVFVVFLTFAFM